MATEPDTSRGGSGGGASSGREAHGSVPIAMRRLNSRAGFPVSQHSAPSPTSQVSEELERRPSPDSQTESRKLERRNLLDSRKDMLDSINAYSVVLVLLVSITFVGFLQPPGGLKQDDTADAGTLQRPGFYMNNYIVPLTISFYLAVAGILLCMSCIIFVLRLPPKSYQSDAEEDIKMLRASLAWAGVQEVMINVFLTFSLFCCTQAFLYAAYTVIYGEQRKLFRRVLYVFLTMNTTFIVTYCISLILSCFIEAPVYIYLQQYIELMIKLLINKYRQKASSRGSDEASGPP